MVQMGNHFYAFTIIPIKYEIYTTFLEITSFMYPEIVQKKSFDQCCQLQALGLFIILQSFRNIPSAIALDKEIFPYCYTICTDLDIVDSMPCAAGRSS